MSAADTSPLDAALRCAGAGLPVFPCNHLPPPLQKKPLSPRGFHDATTDAAIVRAWWARWPNAWIGMPTGPGSGRVVLDIDVKRPQENGWDSLEDLGHLPLPETPMAHTSSGGLHAYFDAGDRELRNSAGLIGPGLDVRGDGGYVILPSTANGYFWDPLYNFETVPMAPAPHWLWPPKPFRQPLPRGHLKPVDGLSPYGSATIESACNAIVTAGAGQQERVLNAESFSIGTAVGGGIIPGDIALRTLLRAASAMPDYDAAWPWRPEEIDFKVRRAFNAGTQHPREVRCAVA